MATAPSDVDRQALADAFLSFLPRLRRRIERRLPEDMREELATVTAHQLEALVWMARSGGVTMNDLARAQNVALSSCTALADRLVRQGLAERRSDPNDRRIVRLVPTERAMVFVERFSAAKRSSALDVLTALDDEEAAAFVRLVGKLAGEEEDCRPRPGAGGGGGCAGTPG